MIVTMKEREKLLTPTELAQWLGVSPQWVRKHASGTRRPQLPGVRLGKLIRFRAEEVEAWLREQGIAA